MLGNDADDVLSVLFGSAEGRPLYNQLIETARVGGMTTHLIKKARLLFWELASSRGAFEAAQRLGVRLQAEAEELERSEVEAGAVIEGEATEL
jgi:hypothetical protein